MRRKNEHDKYWWLVPGEVDNGRESGLVPLSLARASKDFNKVRNIVWKWYRWEVASRTDLSASAKIFGWSLAERWRYETFSSHDALNYYTQMVGLNRKTCGRALQELSDNNLVWIVLEDEKKRLKKSQACGRKHFLLVGLGHYLGEGE